MTRSNSHHAQRYPGMTTYTHVSNTRVRDAGDVTRVMGVLIHSVKRADSVHNVTCDAPVCEVAPIPACDVKRAERINVYA